MVVVQPMSEARQSIDKWNKVSLIIPSLQKMKQIEYCDLAISIIACFPRRRTDRNAIS